MRSRKKESHLLTGLTKRAQYWRSNLVTTNNHALRNVVENKLDLIEANAVKVSMNN
jgi:hypothetical protein